MWKIRKPELTKALSDIDDFVKKGIVNDKEAKALECLTKQYDAQKGEVTKRQHNRIPSEAAERIHKHYSDTSTGNRLDYIRKELADGVTKCPYCAIGLPETLDHYMPKTIYKALALCRLNLVPMCWGCNHTKGHVHQCGEYIHPYYLPALQGIVFLTAEIRLAGDVLDFTFSFDAKAFGNASLYNQFVSHWKNMNLDNRLRKSAIDFLHSEVLTGAEETSALPVYLDMLLARLIRIYGLNDWRTAIVRALVEKLKSEDGEAVVAALAAMGRHSLDINL